MKSVNNEWFDPDNDNDNRVPPKSEVEDDQILLCDECQTGNVILQRLVGDKLQCPQCAKTYNPHFEILKHKNKEFTIDSDDAPTNTGIISFVETPKFKTSVTRIRKKLEKDEMPEYLKQEIEHIQNRLKYRFVKSF